MSDQQSKAKKEDLSKREMEMEEAFMDAMTKAGAPFDFIARMLDLAELMKRKGYKNVILLPTFTDRFGLSFMCCLTCRVTYEDLQNAMGIASFSPHADLTIGYIFFACPKCIEKKVDALVAEAVRLAEETLNGR